ncbi:Usp domain-containing protein [Haematococcus lacustris]|uniref:Usp domain-containing protein n=1 Tax=Haematococcus lacustris TaxID=44745 RepID=A0A699ZUY7_HAELA|nr:Usp domain-containing protein [Haematococcus lacustris]
MTAQLVHVCRYLQPQMTINHSYPGATFDIPNLSDLNEKRHAEEVKAVPASLHLYLDTDNAPASAICSTLMRVADECSAAMVVVACHDKAYGAWDTLMLGSVAEQLQRTCKRPLAIIGDYTVKTAAAPPGPLVIPMRSRHDKE